MSIPGRNWKTTIKDWLRFNAVGIMGTVLQLVMLSLMVKVFGKPNYLILTGIAVEFSILHNFAWHTKWTWADRMSDGLLHKITALLRFNLTTGAVSMLGNLLLMRLFVGTLGWNVQIANLAAIVSCSLLNFVVSDRFVFVESSHGYKTNAATD